jgi:predicted nucleic acid-binding Zn finger protein
MAVLDELEDIISSIRRRRYISLDDAVRIEELTGYKMARIIDEIRRGRAKQYIFKPSNVRIPFFTGRDKEYLILPSVWYCSCISRYPINLLRRRVCYHLLVWRIAEALGKLKTYIVEDEKYGWILDELK